MCNCNFISYTKQWNIQIQTSTNTNVRAVRSKPAQYRSIYSIIINISTEPCLNNISMYLNSRRVCNCDGVMLYDRIPSNDTFEFKHAPILMYLLFVQNQHDAVAYIPSISTSAQSRMLLPLYLNNRRVCNCDGVMVHHIPSNDTFKFKQALSPTYHLFVQRQHDTVPYIQSLSTSA